jgi:hypothetical protein
MRWGIAGEKEAREMCGWSRGNAAYVFLSPYFSHILGTCLLIKKLLRKDLVEMKVQIKWIASDVKIVKNSYRE